MKKIFLYAITYACLSTLSLQSSDIVTLLANRLLASRKKIDITSHNERIIMGVNKDGIKTIQYFMIIQDKETLIQTTTIYPDGRTNIIDHTLQ